MPKVGLNWAWGGLISKLLCCGSEMNYCQIEMTVSVLVIKRSLT